MKKAIIVTAVAAFMALHGAPQVEAKVVSANGVCSSIKAKVKDPDNREFKMNLVGCDENTDGSWTYQGTNPCEMLTNSAARFLLSTGGKVSDITPSTLMGMIDTAQRGYDCTMWEDGSVS